MIWAGLPKVPTISMRFEIFFCIFPFQYLQCCEGFTLLAAKMILLVFLYREYRERYERNKILNLAYDLVWACVG